MNTPQEIARELISKGLHAIVGKNNDVFAGRKVRPEDVSPGSETKCNGDLVRVTKHENEGQMILIGDETIIRASSDGWIFENDPVTSFGGPNWTKVRYQARSATDVAQIAVEYHLGHPTNVDDWLVPFHRFPNCNIRLAREQIAKARTVAQADWKWKAENERYLQTLPKGEASNVQMFDYLFISAPHIHDKNRVLLLRGGGQQAFIVLLE